MGINEGVEDGLVGEGCFELREAGWKVVRVVDSLGKSLVPGAFCFACHVSFFSFSVWGLGHSWKRRMERVVGGGAKRLIL